jgi:hypothetical protein
MEIRNPMMLSSCCANFCCTGSATSHSHFTLHTAVPGGPISPGSRNRLTQWAMLSLAVIVSMLSPVSVWAQDSEAVLYNFCSASGCANGSHPGYAALVFDLHGNIYGITQDGGTGAFGTDVGTVVELSPPAGGTGVWTESVLHSFYTLSGCSDGKNPFGGVIFDSQGNLYGTRPKIPRPSSVSRRARFIDEQDVARPCNTRSLEAGQRIV